MLACDIMLQLLAVDPVLSPLQAFVLGKSIALSKWAIFPAHFDGKGVWQTIRELGHCHGSF